MCIPLGSAFYHGLSNSTQVLVFTGQVVTDSAICPALLWYFLTLLFFFVQKRILFSFICKCVSMCEHACTHACGCCWSPKDIMCPGVAGTGVMNCPTDMLETKFRSSARMASTISLLGHISSSQTILQASSSSTLNLFSSLYLHAPRPEKDGSATGVNMICTHRSEPTGIGLDPKQLYWELSRETHGITQLDFITLDKNSLYVNGECVSSCRYLPQGVHYTF